MRVLSSYDPRAPRYLHNNRLLPHEPTVRMTHVLRDGVYYHATCYARCISRGVWASETGRAIDCTKEPVPHVMCGACRCYISPPREAA